MAFRTADGLDRGPVDEGFHDPGMLAAWWSLVLRDEGPEATAACRSGAAGRHATRAVGTPATGTGPCAGTAIGSSTGSGSRYDLLTDPIAADRSRALRR